MKLKVYSKFELIPICEELKNSIPIFATQQYADYLFKIKKNRTIWFKTDHNDSLNYLIPFSIMKRGPFKKGVFLTNIISAEKNSFVEYEKEFLNTIIEYIKRNNLCDWIEQCPNWAIFNTYPSGAVYAPFGTYRINMEDKTQEEIFKNLDRRVRQSINKAIREKVVIIKDGKYNRETIELIRKTLKLAKIKAFTHIKFDVFLKNNFVDYTAYLGDQPQSSVVFLYNSYSTYAMYAGRMENSSRGATCLLYWEAIKESKGKNIKYFDFVGARINPEKDSKLFRIQQFKSHFGGKLHEGFIWKMILNRSKYFLYTFYVKTLNLIRGKKNKGDIIDQEIKRLGKR